MERDPDRGRRVRELHEQRGMSRTAAATRVGVSPNAYKAWEQGGIIDWPNVERLATAFNVSTDFIMTGKDEPVTPDLVGEIRSALEQRKADRARWDAEMASWQHKITQLLRIQAQAYKAWRENDERAMVDIEASALMLLGSPAGSTRVGPEPTSTSG